MLNDAKIRMKRVQRDMEKPSPSFVSVSDRINTAFYENM